MRDRLIKITMEKASILVGQGHTEMALTLLSDTATLLPGNPELTLRRTDILLEMSRFSEARLCFEDLLLSRPELSADFFRIGGLFAKKGFYQTAKNAFTKVIATNKLNVGALNNLGLCNIELGRYQEALDALTKAVELKPDSAEFHNNLANLYMLIFRLGDAVRHYQRAVDLNPEYQTAYSSLGRAYRLCGDARAMTTIRKSLELDPTSRYAVDVLLFSLNYVEQDPLNVYSEHIKWAPTAYHAADKRLPALSASDHNKIRIGYVSADFRNHPVATFFKPVLQYFDRNRFDIYCYANVSNPDATTETLRALGGTWRTAVGLSDQELADQIRLDRIDILIDLGGFTEGHRLGSFILRPAPIQCSWLGYPNTTGLPQIDYRITDAIADPPGMTERYFTEHLVRLPHTFLCYTPETTDTTLPCPEGPITFCCFNHLPKISEPLIAMWGAILTELPEAQLLLKSAFLADPAVQTLTLSRFEAQGVNSDRIELRGFTLTRQEHLNLYGSCHIALDTYPYHGTTTTCEALWMGVPVISLGGTSHVSRVGTSILAAIGAPELIAANSGEYVTCAVELARDPDRLQAYRQTLRMKMQTSRLMDQAGFVADLETAFRDMLR